jgi:hypothetical protein
LRISQGGAQHESFYASPAACLVGREPRLGGEGGCRRDHEAENESSFQGVISWGRSS